MRRNDKTCSYKGCDKKHYAKGFCRNHYTNLRTRDTPDYAYIPSAMERLMSKVTISENGCWEYGGVTTKWGYGAICSDGKTFSAHRFMFENKFSAIPEGLWVLHKCDNPGCVNPEHLFLGTTQQNTKDRNAKNRQARGVSHGRAKMSEEDVLSMRSQHKNGVPVKELAVKYSISLGNAYAIISRAKWKHI